MKKLKYLKISVGQDSDFKLIMKKISPLKKLEFLEISTSVSLANKQPIKVNPEEYFKNFPNLNALSITGYRLQKKDGFDWNTYQETELLNFECALSLRH